MCRYRRNLRTTESRTVKYTGNSTGERDKRKHEYSNTQGNKETQKEIDKRKKEKGRPASQKSSIEIGLSFPASLLSTTRRGGDQPSLIITSLPPPLHQTNPCHTRSLSATQVRRQRGPQHVETQRLIGLMTPGILIKRVLSARTTPTPPFTCSL